MNRCLGCMEQIADGETVCPLCGYKKGTDVKEAYYLLPGKILAGKYLVGKVLGYGGFGVTYIGWDMKLNRKVAIKEYLPSDFATRSYGTMQLTVFSGEATVQYEAGLKSFLSEAQRLAKFNRVPEIVDIYDCFMENDTGYIIMEFLEGEDVKHILRQKKKLDPREATNIIIHILHGLIDVHKAGIIHRDIAPDNIFITKDGEVKLLDFGASRYATAVQSRSLSVILKPGYAPEEQYRSRGEQGPWTDVYAVAATFYRMLTGCRPKEAIERLVEDDLKKPSELGVELPENIETALMNALNVRQEFRTKDAETFYIELKSSQVERVVEKVSVEKSKIPLWGKIIAGVAGIAVVIGATLLVASQSGVFDRTAAAPGKAEYTKDECLVPGITDKTVDEAKVLLKAEGLELTISDSRYSDEIEYRHILQQAPESGALARKGDRVNVIISGGTDNTFLADLKGLAEEEAAAEIKSVRLTAGEPVREISETVPKGCVISQSVVGEVKVGATVQLTVSLGKESEQYADIKVPDLTGKTYKEAEEQTKKIAVNGITFLLKKKLEYSDKVDKGKVIRQDLKAGTVENTRKDITVWVSRGPEMVVMPKVIFNSRKKAEAALKKVGLKVRVKEAYSSDVPKGNVIDVSEKNNTEVKKGSTVVITVSLGEEPVRNTNTNTDRTTGSDTGSKRKEEKNRLKIENDDGPKIEDGNGLKIEND